MNTLTVNAQNQTKAQRRMGKKLYSHLCELQSETSPHFARIIVRHEGSCKHLPEWFTGKSADYYKGLLAGNYVAIESILGVYNAYNGYCDVEKVISVGVDYTYSHRQYSF